MSAANLDRVRGLIADVFGVQVERITPESSQENLEGWDSLQHLNIVLSVESQFDVRLTPSEAEGLRSVGAIVELLAQKQAR